MKRTYLTVVAAVLLMTGCAGPAVVTIDDSARPMSDTTQAAAPTTTRPSNALLVDASEYVVRVDGRAVGYYFTSPSGRWSCAIFPREQAGCQSASGSVVSIDGAPDEVLDVNGKSTAPTAIVVDRTGDARFAAPEQPVFRLDTGPANELEFNRILAVASFRCNVHEQSGISCGSETTGNGFTFAADGYSLSYTDLPPPA